MGVRKESVNSNSSSEKENQTMQRGEKKSAANEFTQAISKVVVAQICESIGFQGFQQSAMNALTDIGIRYIREIGKAASSSANSLNRSQCNVFDVIQGLEDLESIQGFAGGSDVGHSLSQSGVVKGMVRYVQRVEEIPFAYSIPPFQVAKKRKLELSYALANENPPSGHIPSWLPKFPDPEKEKGLDMETTEKIKQANERFKRYPGNGSKVEAYVEGNPFLAAPLQLGEKVSLLSIPAKDFDEDVGCDQNGYFAEKRVTNSEPSSEANESEGRQKVLVSNRPSVRFKFGNHKKSLGTVTKLQNGNIENFSLWFGKHQDGSEVKNGFGERVHLRTQKNHQKNSACSIYS